jgi:hypothetical protein
MKWTKHPLSDLNTSTYFYKRYVDVTSFIPQIKSEPIDGFLWIVMHHYIEGLLCNFSFQQQGQKATIQIAVVVTTKLPHLGLFIIQFYL